MSLCSPQTAGPLAHDYQRFKLSAAASFAVRGCPTASGLADYTLLIKRQLAGIVAARKEGTCLMTVCSAIRQVPSFLACAPEPRWRPIFGFHQPDTLRDWPRQPGTLRAQLRLTTGIFFEKRAA